MSGDYLRSIFDNHNIQPKAVAAQTGIDPATLSRILNNRNQPSDKHLSQILQAVGMIRARDTKKDEPTSACQR